MPDRSTFYSWLKEQPGKVITIKDEKADAPPPAKTIEVEYHRPFQMHGSIGPHVPWRFTSTSV